LYGAPDVRGRAAGGREPVRTRVGRKSYNPP